jgi:hypothetical protein
MVSEALFINLLGSTFRTSDNDDALALHHGIPISTPSTFFSKYKSGFKPLGPPVQGNFQRSKSSRRTGTFLLDAAISI